MLLLFVAVVVVRGGVEIGFGIGDGVELNVLPLPVLGLDEV